ncbi:MAG: hypothetical protein AB7K36_18475 [Chloroflexota bacterium]
MLDVRDDVTAPLTDLFTVTRPRSTRREILSRSRLLVAVPHVPTARRLESAPATATPHHGVDWWPAYVPWRATLGATHQEAQWQQYALVQILPLRRPERAEVRVRPKDEAVTDDGRHPQVVTQSPMGGELLGLFAGPRGAPGEWMQAATT